MKSTRVPLILLGLVYLALAASLVYAAGEMPPRVATHFNAAGQPNGWMSREADLWFAALFGALFPLALIGVFALIRYLPKSLVNLPHKEYWLAPEHLGETCAALLRFGVWLACVSLLFFTILHLLIVESNRSPQPHLPPAQAFGLLGAYLAAVLAFVVLLYRRFGQPPVTRV